MKRKLFGSLFKTRTCVIFSMVAIACFGLASCGDDDDDNGGSSNGSDKAGVLTTTDGTSIYLKQVGSLSFAYDTSGKVTSCSYYTDDYNFTYNPFTITHESNESYGTTKVELSNISLNGKGYITKMKESIYDTWSDGSYESSSGTYSFSYDGSGHLTKVSGSGSWTYYEDGETEKGSVHIEYHLTWSNGNLVKVVYKYNDSGEEETETVTNDYDTSLYPNVTRQYTNNYFAQSIEDLDFLFFLGYLGVAGEYHPVSATYVCTYEDEDTQETDTDSYKYKYTLNSNGSVATSSYSYNNGSYRNTSYSYYPEGSFSSGSKASAKSRSLAPEQTNRKTRHSLGLFKSRRDK
ncbi:MAG: DUF4595 domain-containing protein [Prevotellaceae bacterium]|nr:DUF4595 domain-containing protein [Prevotellaceae bacterium]